ncbi:MAG TPA: hypothetical protein VLC91_05400 [Spongiibacteraceae bacterium]|nr:hypothetical protein [Spongiibacteraceae bacterium]
MLGLTQLGVVHTAISLVAVAVAAGIVAFARYKQIAVRTCTGILYVVTTALTCLTGFGIFQHGGFGAPHALGILTLLVLAIIAETRHSFGRLSRYIAVLGFSTTFFFHMIPAFTETSTLLPFGHPLASGPDDPGLKAAIGVAFLVFVVGAVLQILQVRAERNLTAAPI